MVEKLRASDVCLKVFFSLIGFLMLFTALFENWLVVVFTIAGLLYVLFAVFIE